MRRTILTLAGILLLAFGLLFLLQGQGTVRWPSSSFMIDQQVWVTRGALLALLGAILLAIAWFVNPRRS